MWFAGSGTHSSWSVHVVQTIQNHTGMSPWYLVRMYDSCQANHVMVMLGIHNLVRNIQQDVHIQPIGFQAS